MTMLAVFRSRAQALDALSLLKGAGVPSQAVSTPKEAGIGCGVSVKFDCNFFPRVRPLLANAAIRRSGGICGYAAARLCASELAFLRAPLYNRCICAHLTKS